MNSWHFFRLLNKQSECCQSSLAPLRTVRWKIEHGARGLGSHLMQGFPTFQANEILLSKHQHNLPKIRKKLMQKKGDTHTLHCHWVGHFGIMRTGISSPLVCWQMNQVQYPVIIRLQLENDQMPNRSMWAIFWPFNPVPASRVPHQSLLSKCHCSVCVFSFLVSASSVPNPFFDMDNWYIHSLM